MTPDGHRARRGGLRGLDRLHGRHRGGVRAPRSRDARPRRRASRSCATRPRPTTRCSATSIAGELISVGDRDPLRPRRGLRRRRSPASATTAGGCSRSPPTTASRWAPPARTRGPTTASSPIIDTEHYRRVDDGLQYVAWRNNTFSLHVHVGVQRRRPRGRASATACARCCRRCWPSRQLALPRRPRLRPALGAHARSSPRASRAAASPTPSATGRPTPTTSTSSIAHELDRRGHAGLVDGAAALLRSAPSRCASATPRRTRAESRGARGADRRLRRPGRARRGRGRAARATCRGA